ncbi:MAG: efflux RND transporter periplasmic adaptor subunit [Planctomycetota bacterium]
MALLPPFRRAPFRAWLPAWLGVACGVGLWGCSEPPAEEAPPRPVIAFQVPADDAFEMRRFSGRAQAADEVNLSFRVSGPLLGLPVDVGDTVEAGQPVALIDPNDYELEVRNVEAQLRDAKTQLALAQEEAKRIERAFQGGAANELERLESQASADSAAAQVTAYEASLQTAQDELSYTTLKAPFSGRVVAKFVDNFENVQAQEPVLRLVDDRSIEMVIDIPESLIGLIRPGGEGFAQFDALPDLVLPANIKEIGTEASEVTRTYPVTISIPQPEVAPGAEGESAPPGAPGRATRILAGMTGQAWGRRPDIPTEYHVVPVSAVFEDEGQRTVWVLTPEGGDSPMGAATKRAVELGETLSRGVQVKGLETGEWVAVAGVHYLKEGQRVRIQGEPAASAAAPPIASAQPEPEPEAGGASGGSGTDGAAG